MKLSLQGYAKLDLLGINVGSLHVRFEDANFSMMFLRGRLDKKRFKHRDIAEFLKFHVTAMGLEPTTT